MSRMERRTSLHVLGLAGIAGSASYLTSLDRESGTDRPTLPPLDVSLPDAESSEPTIGVA